MFFQFETNWVYRYSRDKRVIQDSMLYDPIQGQGHGGPKVGKMANFKVISSASMHVIKRLMVNYDTKSISKFCLDSFFIFVLIRRHVTFKAWVL